MGLRGHRPRAEARRAGAGGYQRSGATGRYRADQHHGRLPGVLAARPGGDVRPRAGGLATLAVAAAAARAGARLLLQSELTRHPAEAKGAGNYVTEWDRSSEAAIVEVLARETPGVPILAEEAGGTPATTMWAVDPLDGTTNFMRGLPVVGVSVALL